MFTLDNTDVNVNDLSYLIDFEMTPLLDMTLEITDIETSDADPRTPLHYFFFGGANRNDVTTRIHGCSTRNTGRKSRATK